MSADHGEHRFAVKHERHGEYGTTAPTSPTLACLCGNGSTIAHILADLKLSGEFTAPLCKPRKGQLPG